jgi:hypothetical protein
VPNKFFEADGRVIDISGANWDSFWGHVDAPPSDNRHQSATHHGLRSCP